MLFHFEYAVKFRINVTMVIYVCVYVYVCVCVCVYRLVAELQQLVCQPVGVSDEFLQRLFETDGFLKDLITAIHSRGVRRLKRTKQTQ